MIAAGADPDATALLAVTAAGTARRFPLSELPVAGRGGKGLKVGEAPLVACVPATAVHLVVAGEPTVLRASDLPEGRRTARGTALAGAVAPGAAVEPPA